MTARASITQDDEYCIIKLPLSEVHALRVALQECPCGANKSKATQDRRMSLAKALGRVRVPK